MVSSGWSKAHTRQIDRDGRVIKAYNWLENNHGVSWHTAGHVRERDDRPGSDHQKPRHRGAGDGI